MAVRTGMVDLVNTLELLVQDTSNNDLSEDEYQNILDLQSHRIIRHCLVPLDKDGKYWRASCGYFESDTRAPELKDYDDNTLSHTADYNNGVFILDTPDDTIQVYLWDGYVYNIYAAAYLACNLLIAKIKNEYSITVAEGSFSRFDRVETLEKLGMMYSSMSDTFTVPMSDYDYTSTIYQRDNYIRW